MYLTNAKVHEQIEVQHPAESPANLDEILARIWMQLTKGAQRNDEPFHLGVLATNGPEGPSLRTIVLRAVFPEQRMLICHTDIRSSKLNEINLDNRIAWLFYDVKGKIQLRLSGEASIHTDDGLAKCRWQGTQLSARRCYLAAHGPGTPIATASTGLPSSLEGRSPTVEESERGWEQFAVIACHVQKMDWLCLNARGHRRANFHWDGHKWRAIWVAP